VQFNPAFGEVNRNLDRAEALIEGAQADLLVLPELFNTGYLITSKEEIAALAEEVPGGPTTRRLAAVAKRRNLHLVAGMAERSGDRIYNAAVLISPAGHVATYRKVHLFFEEKLWFDPGDGEFPVYDIGACRVGIMVCFDWFFPEAMRTLALKGAQVVCHPANLVLPYCQAAMVTRCLENRVFAVTCNRTGTEQRGGKSLHYTGKSQITDTMGDILSRAGEDEECVGVFEVDPAKALDKQLNAHNNLFGDRRPSFYRDICRQAAVGVITKA
jgi:predicted amidohydrolase